MIDWDAWHSRGVPGAIPRALRERRTAPRASAARSCLAGAPWRSPGFAAFSHDYGRDFGLDPRAEEWEIVGLAWWAAKVAGTLRRLPERAEDERWLADIVDPVLASLA